MNAIINNKQGLVYTFTWAFDMQSDWKEMERIRDKFKGYKFHYVELVCDLEERLIRNKTENRLSNKASKRVLEWSKNEII